MNKEEESINQAAKVSYEELSNQVCQLRIMNVELKSEIKRLQQGLEIVDALMDFIRTVHPH